MSYVDRAAEDFLRSAIVKVRKEGRDVVRGACKTYDGCTDLSKPVRGRRVCVMCAALLVEKLPTSTPTNEFTLEEALALALDVDRQWVVSMLRGFDGDKYGLENEHHEAYHVGKRLWRLFGTEEGE